MDFRFWKKKPEPVAVVKRAPKAESGSLINSWGVTRSFDGEKNWGEMGPAIHYLMDHDTLRVRSWQSYLESDISQTVLNKFVMWTVDGGLKLNTNPSKVILASAGINLDSEKFNEIVEARFTAWAKSKRSSYSGMMSFNEIQAEAKKNAKIGGDVLVVLRVIDGTVKVQLIDGAHVQNPLGLPINNNIKNGVEVDSTGRHVAYHVRTGLNKFERIPAINEAAGLVTAFLFYGVRYRIDTRRGLPAIATCLETIKKLERYKEAAVGSADERQ